MSNTRATAPRWSDVYQQAIALQALSFRAEGEARRALSEEAAATYLAAMNARAPGAPVVGGPVMLQARAAVSHAARGWFARG